MLSRNSSAQIGSLCRTVSRATARLDINVWLNEYIQTIGATIHNASTRMRHVYVCIRTNDDVGLDMGTSTLLFLLIPRRALARRFPSTPVPDPTDEQRAEETQQQHAANREEHARDARFRLDGDWSVGSVGGRRRRGAAGVPASVAVSARALMALLVEVRDVVPVPEGILAGAHAAHGAGAGARRRGGTTTTAAATGALLVRGPPLLALRPPAAGAEEARRRTLERAAATTEARGGTAAGHARGRVGPSLYGSRGCGRGVEVHVFAVVFGALRGRGQDRVGLADAHEAPRGGAAGGRLVEVGVVRLGEVVEGSGTRGVGGLVSSSEVGLV